MIKSQMSTRCICAALQLWQQYSAPLPANSAVGLKEPTRRKCMGLPDRNFLVKLHNIANWSKHVVIVIKKHGFQKQRFQSTVRTFISIRTALSADSSTSSRPHYILWPLKHFVDCCQKVFGWKRPRPAWTGGWQVGWRCWWIKSRCR